MNRILLAGAALLLSQPALLGQSARAQSASNPAALRDQGNVNFQGPKGAKARREPAPPALPGSRAEPMAVAPAERSAADMPPTEALFDAINRGDLATAKDAIGRGADLNGRNVLGLTPLEQSVDLGRNQISFLLLSMRGGSGFNTSSGPGPAERVPTAAERRAERLAAAQAERAARQQAVATRVAAPAPQQTARLFAGDGGAPVPGSGFLGFDPGR